MNKIIPLKDDDIDFTKFTFSNSNDNKMTYIQHNNKAFIYQTPLIKMMSGGISNNNKLSIPLDPNIEKHNKMINTFKQIDDCITQKMNSNYQSIMKSNGNKKCITARFDINPIDKKLMTQSYVKQTNKINKCESNMDNMKNDLSWGSTMRAILRLVGVFTHDGVSQMILKIAAIEIEKSSVDKNKFAFDCGSDDDIESDDELENGNEVTTETEIEFDNIVFDIEI